MSKRFEGQVAIVTGASTQIGEETAYLFAREGASVIANAPGYDLDTGQNSADYVDKVVNNIKANGGEATATYHDVSMMEESEHLISAAINTYGNLDILVNCCLVPQIQKIYQTSFKEFDHAIKNNLKGTFCPTKHASIQFRKQRRGRVVNITSNAGLGGIDGAGFAAASEGIIGLTRTVARDLGRYSVTCNAIASKSGFDHPGESNKKSKKSRDESPSITPENVASLAVFLCTDLVPNVNGCAFNVDENRISLYSNPSIKKSIHKWGTFTISEIEALVPENLSLI